MMRDLRRSDANEPGQSRFLAHHMDDCWDPEDAPAILLRERTRQGQTGGAQARNPLCLRVVGNDPDQAQVVQADYECDEAERPGSASYLWVLYSDSPPTREEMIALYREYASASGDSRT